MFSSRKARRFFAATALISTMLVPISTSAHAARTGDNVHCVITVSGKDASGNFIIEKTTCYDTFAAVLRSRGVANVSPSIAPATVGSAVLLSAGIIGTHYDGASGSGSSVSVEGSDCSGGGLNLPSSWNDRISSTTNGCPIVAHWEHANYTGAVFGTYTIGLNSNITGYMNNRTTSIKYHS